jgi:hypothetical protein
MDIYFVYAKDTYVDVNGSQRDLDVFGPWFNYEDAKTAAGALKSKMQLSYSGTGNMPLYEGVDIERREVFDGFDEAQLFI